MTKPTIAGAIQSLDERFDLTPLPEANGPVFVLASGWRSGSTLMQRLVASTNEILMWGEPYDLSNLVVRMADSLRPFGDRWPPKDAIVDGAPDPGDWTAKAYPHPEHLMAAHRALFDRLLAAPALEAGFGRWGVKEVRLDGEHAFYLQRVFPDARFVFVHRNPYDAYLSYRGFHDLRSKMGWWWWRWPDVQVTTAAEFGAMWQSLTESFLEWSPRLGGEVIGYEDFSVGTGLDRIERLIGTSIDREVLKVKLARKPGRSKDDGVEQAPLSEAEHAGIEATAGPLARRLGYDGPTGDAR